MCHVVESRLTMSSNSCAESKGAGRYPLFVRAGNEALNMLRSIKHKGMKDANNELQILFHCSDPRPHGGHDPNDLIPECKPSIVITSLGSARNLMGVEESHNTTWESLTTSSTPQPLAVAFGWYDVLSLFELRHVKPKLAPPSASFDSMKPIPHHDNIYAKFDARKRDRHLDSEPNLSAKRIKIISTSNCIMSTV